MNAKRMIHVTDDKGKTIYTGEDKRFYSSEYPKCALGIPITDWFKVGGFTVAFAITFTTMRIDINEIKTMCSKFSQYIENHDSWDSSVFDVRFKNGEPIDPNFKSSINFK